MEWLKNMIRFMWFRNIKITWKLIFIVAVLSLAGIVGGIISAFTLNDLGKRTNSLFFNNMQGVLEVNYTKLDVDEVRYNIYNIVNRGEVSAVPMVKQFIGRMDMHISTLKKKFPTVDIDYLEETWALQKPKMERLLENPDAFVKTQEGRGLNQGVESIWRDLLLLEADAQTIGINDLKKETKVAQDKANMMVIFVIVMLGIALVLGFFTIISISRPLSRLRQSMLALSKGNLKNPELTSNTKDEIGETTAAYEASIRQLREMIGRVSEVTTSLTDIVGELTPQIASAGSAAEVVTQTMNELSKGTQEQARAADEVANTIHLIVDQIERVNRETQVIADYSTTVIAEAKQGEEDTQEIMTQVTDLANASNKATGVIQNLHQYSQEIEEIVGKIREITEQTQLLALNASIEAARAGEYGRGFGVVAHEVGKLAQKSSRSVQDVEQVLGNIRNMVLEAIKVMEEGVSKANEGKRRIVETSERFNQIFASINKVAAEIQVVAGETANLTQANQKVLEEIDTIAAISEETAANTEEVMATVENQANSVNEVANGMRRLNDFSEDLDQSVSRFRL